MKKQNSNILPKKIVDNSQISHLLCCFKKGFRQAIICKNGFNRIFGIAGYVLVIPFCLFTTAIILFIYTAFISVTIIIWFLFIILTSFFAILGTITMSYGIANLFISVPISIMEFGLGTVCFAIMLTVWSLNYQFILLTIPFLRNILTSLLNKFLKCVESLITTEGETTA